MGYRFGVDTGLWSKQLLVAQRSGPTRMIRDAGNVERTRGCEVFKV